MYLETGFCLNKNSLHAVCLTCGTVMTTVADETNVNVLQCSTCKKKYDVVFERRKHVRKEVKTEGHCFCAGTKRHLSFEAIIVDISKEGLRFSASDLAEVLMIGQYVRIKFLLSQKKVNVLVQIVNMHDKTKYGCIFMPEYSKSDSIEIIESWIESQTT